MKGPSRMLLLVVAVVGVLSSPGLAHFQEKRDPNDSSDRLDISEAVMSHTRRLLYFRLSTFSDWEPSEIAIGKRTVAFILDTVGGPTADYAITVTYDESIGDFRCSVAKYRSGRDVGDCNASHSEPNWISATVGRRMVEATGEWMAWRSFIANLETDVWDDAPNSGRYRHNFR